ncbi:hypothetical protein ACXYRO_01155 [Mycoplasma sp. 4013]
MEKNIHKNIIQICISDKYFDSLFIQLKNIDSKKTQKDLKRTILDELIYNKFINNISPNNINWIFEKKQYQGLFITNTNTLVYFSQKLNKKFKLKSRNAFIKQNSLPIIKLYENNPQFKNIYLCLNPLDWYFLKLKNQKLYISNSVILDLEQLIYIDFKISYSFLDFIDQNIKNKTENLSRNLSLIQSIKQKQLSSLKNKLNKPLIIEYQMIKNHIFIDVYGKFDGVNRQDTLLSCKIISKLSHQFEQKTLNLWLLNGDSVSMNIKKYVTSLGFSFQYNTTVNEQTNKYNYDIDKTKQFLLRNQKFLRANIYKKYNNYINIGECFACDYNINENLITAHIYRHTDIQAEHQKNNISIDDAFNLTTSGDNRFLLCPNHDKEYEKGVIFFDPFSFAFKVNKHFFLKHETKKINYVDSKLINKFNNLPKNALSSIFNTNFINNINKHITRLKIINE